MEHAIKKKTQLTPTNTQTTHNHTHPLPHNTSKMADDVSLQIENALNSIINSTDKSGNLKKELRQEIHTTVSSLRKLVHSLRSELLDKKHENQKLTIDVKQPKDTLDKGRPTTSARHVATSVNANVELASSWSMTSETPIGGKKKIFLNLLNAKTKSGIS